MKASHTLAISVGTTVFAVLMTYVAWRSVFSESMLSALPSWIRGLLFCTGMWPSMLVEQLGWQVTNRTSGVTPNIVGWNLLMMLVIITYRRARTLRVRWREERDSLTNR